MDKILTGILNSTHPVKIKLAILHQLSETVQPENIKKVLTVCLDYFKKGSDHSDPLDLAMDHLFLNWIKHNKDISVTFLTEELLNKPLHQMENHLKVTNIKSISKCLKTVSTVHDLSSSPIKPLLKTYLHASVLKVDGMDLLVSFCHLYLQHPSLLQSDFDFLTTFSSLIFKVVGSTQFVFMTKKVKNKFYKDLEVIFKFFDQNISTNSDVMKETSRVLFSTLSNQDEQPSISVARFIQAFNIEKLSFDLEMVFYSNVTDESLILFLCRVVDWTCFPTDSDYIEKWIVHIMKLLLKINKSQVLYTVIESKINQMCNLVFFPTTSKASIAVLTFSLMCYLHCPLPFHQAAPNLKRLIETLNSVESSKAQAIVLAELVYTLMYHFPGYPDVYSSLLTTLKDFHKPKECKMKEWLTASSLLPISDMSAMVTTRMKSDTGKIGLVNLGNTCYMNSVLQAIYNLHSFRCDVLSNTYSIAIQKFCSELQKIFALLYKSMRPAIVPNFFHESSRPEWFRPGSQQDCSEYFKHLLDHMEMEEERLTKYFTGVMQVSVECMNCSSISAKKELYNDLPLSFRDNSANSCTLKGGDPSGSKSFSMRCNLGNSSKIQIDEDGDDPDVSSDDSLTGESLLGMLNAYFQPEMLTDANKYFCNQCLSLHDATKRIRVLEFPRYLTLTLKRFTFNVKSQKRSKLLQQLDYPETFSLCSGCVACEGLTEKTNSDLNATIYEGCLSKQKYHLSSVIVHSGVSLDSGHYYCYVREDNSWFLMNDSRVSKASVDIFTKSGNSFPRDTPYVCIYEKCDYERTGTVINVPAHIVDMVSKDNQAYLEELALEESKRKKRTFNYPKKKDDDDDSPNGPCNDPSQGLNFSGGNFIY